MGSLLALPAELNLIHYERDSHLEAGSIWQKAWPAYVVLAIPPIPVSVAFLIWNLAMQHAKHRNLFMNNVITMTPAQVSGFSGWPAQFAVFPSSQPVRTPHRPPPHQPDQSRATFIRRMKRSFNTKGLL